MPAYTYTDSYIKSSKSIGCFSKRYQRLNLLPPKRVSNAYMRSRAGCGTVAALGGTVAALGGTAGASGAASVATAPSGCVRTARDVAGRGLWRPGRFLPS